MFASCIGGKIMKKLNCRYKIPIESDSDESDEEKDFKKSLMKKIKITISNGFTYARNSIIWTIKEKSTKEDFRKLITLFLGAYLSFISFFFLRIMTTAFEPFGCEYQPNGKYTLKKSTDLFW